MMREIKSHSLPGPDRWVRYLIAIIWLLGIIALFVASEAAIHRYGGAVAIAGSIAWTALLLRLVRLTYNSEFLDALVSPVDLIGVQTNRIGMQTKRRWRLRSSVSLIYYAALGLGSYFLVRPVFHMVIKTGWGFLPCAGATFAIVIGAVTLLDRALRRSAGPIAITRRWRDLLFIEVPPGSP